MLCEYCLNNLATTQLTKLLNDKKHTIHLCESCARKQTQDLHQQFTPTKNIAAPFVNYLNNLENATSLIAKTLEKELESLRLLSRFPVQTKNLLKQSAIIAKQHGHNLLIPSHLLLAITKSLTGKKIFNFLEIDLQNIQENLEISLQAQQMFFLNQPNTLIISSQTRKVLELAEKQSLLLKQTEINTEHILLGIIEEKTSQAAFLLKELGVTSVAAKLAIVKNLETTPALASINQNKVLPKTPSLDYFSTDLTALAAEGKLDPVIGRSKELDRTTQILCRRTKNNPVLIGEPGVGKTAIVEGLAQKIFLEQVPEALKNKRVISLDLSALVAGTKYRGEFEERVLKILEEIKKNKHQIILFIDELHTVVGAGSAEGALDGANILKPDLAKGNLQCIGATTIEEYRKHIEKDRALERRFQTVLVEEASIPETIAILKGLQTKYEDYHGVTFSKAAIESCAKLSQQYIGDRFLPDKAIDCLDEAAVRVRLKQTKPTPKNQQACQKLASLKQWKKFLVEKQDYEQAALVQKEIDSLASKEEFDAEQVKKPTAQKPRLIVEATDVEEIIAKWANVPLTRISDFEQDLLKNLDLVLASKVIGQNEIIACVADSIRKARLGLSDKKRPNASFMFLGPTGVGKTYLAKVLAEELFGSQESLIKLDMSEYMEKHSVSKLIGSPPGYIGYEQAGQLTEKVRRKPYSVILLDELEKAHQDIYHILLQILEDGLLTDSQGRKVSFKNTIIIATSNLGGAEIQKALSGKQLGFASNNIPETKLSNLNLSLQKKLQNDLKKYFNPEFLARLDEILFFKPLEKTSLEKIMNIFLEDLAQRMQQQQHIDLTFTSELKKTVLKNSCQLTSGARALRKEIAQIEKFLAALLLSRKNWTNRSLLLDWQNNICIRPTNTLSAKIESTVNC